MDSLSSTIISIVRTYCSDPQAAIDRSAALVSLDIDCLDMPMIFLDIEDALDVQLSAAEEADATMTVAGLIRSVAASLDAKREAASRTVMRRPKRTWVSTGAGR